MDPLDGIARRFNEPLAAVNAIHRHKGHLPPHPTHHHDPPDSSSAILSTASYKELKEAWIADQTGSSIHLVNTLGLVMLTTYAIWAVIRAKRLRFVQVQQRLSPRQVGNPILAMLVTVVGKVSDWQLEFLILIVPAVGAHTVLAQHLVLTNAALISMLLLLVFSGPPLMRRREQVRRGKRHWSKKHSDDEEEQRHFTSPPHSSRHTAAGENELPFRVSIDSAADAAHASAAPPNFYDGPGSLHSSSSHRDGDMSIDTSMSTAPQSPLLSSAGSMFPPSARGSEALLSPEMGSTSTLTSTRQGPVELAALKTQLLHSRDGSDAQSLVSASSVMSPLARSVVDPWSRSKPTSVDHSSMSHTEELNSHDPSQPPPPPPTTTTAIRNSANPAENSTFVRPQPFLTVYRAHMMLVTIISILAVDFPVFPRSMSKCESWGTSWMDMGVGSFVFSLGIISALPLLKSPRNRFKSVKQQLASDFRKAFPLMMLGMVRVVMVKGVEYPEHVTEYGVHWNFFFTLAVLPFSATLSRPFARYVRYSVLGLLLTLGHQILLKMTRWQDWAIADIPRDTLLTQNKEGLTSMPGYLAIFYIGLDLGHYVLPLDPYYAYRKLRRRRAKPKTDKLAMVLSSLAILYWLGYAVVGLGGGGTSRRLANMGYVMWVVAFNVSFLLGYVVVYWLVLQPTQQAEETEQGGERGEVTPGILEDLNRHSLGVFLLANLLTGLVNVSVRTMYMGRVGSVVILLGYTGVCCGMARVLTAKGVRLKF